MKEMHCINFLENPFHAISNALDNLGSSMASFSWIMIGISFMFSDSNDAYSDFLNDAHGCSVYQKGDRLKPPESGRSTLIEYR